MAEVELNLKDPEFVRRFTACVDAEYAILAQKSQDPASTVKVDAQQAEKIEDACQTGTARSLQNQPTPTLSIVFSAPASSAEVFSDSKRR